MEPAVLSMKNSNKGFTLIELIIAMVVLSIGLTGVLSVMMTTINNSVSPELSWQMSTIAENVIERLLSKNEVITVSNAQLKDVFPELSQAFNGSQKIKISINAQPYLKTNNAKLICVILTHPFIGETHFCAIKTTGGGHE